MITMVNIAVMALMMIPMMNILVMVVLIMITMVDIAVMAGLIMITMVSEIYGTALRMRWLQSHIICRCLDGIIMKVGA